MKSHLLLGALLCSPVVHAEGEGYSNFLRQTQQSTGVVWSVPVDPTGEAASPGLLEEDGALFQLWTIEQTTAKEYLLDQKLVGTYLPRASVTVTTGDPYSITPRTRVDQPFTVTVDVGGLLSGTGLPLAATRVLLEQHLANYTATKISLTPAEATSGTPAASAYIMQNGASRFSFPVSNLKAADPRKASGEEHFVVHALSDGTLTQTQIASGHVQVWPMATGTINGIKDGDQVSSKAPEDTLTMKDLYPDNSTYLQIYEGGKAPGTKGEKLTASNRTWDEDVPLDDTRTFSGYDAVFKKDGTYTMELLTDTPFKEGELLHSVTFTVDRALEVRAQLGSLEGE